MGRTEGERNEATEIAERPKPIGNAKGRNRRQTATLISGTASYAEWPKAIESARQARISETYAKREPRLGLTKPPLRGTTKTNTERDPTTEAEETAVNAEHPKPRRKRPNRHHALGIFGYRWLVMYRPLRLPRGPVTVNPKIEIRPP